MKCRGKHDTTWTIPRSITLFLSYISRYIGENQLPLGQCGGVASGQCLGCFTRHLSFSPYFYTMQTIAKGKSWAHETPAASIYDYFCRLSCDHYIWHRRSIIEVEIFRLLACLKSCHVVALSQCYKLSPSSAKGYFFRYKFSSLNRAYTGPWRTFRNNHDYSKSEKLEINVCSILATRSIKM